MPVRSFDDLYEADAEARRPGGRARREAGGRALELVPRVRRLRGPDHPARVRPLRRGEGDRHAGRAVLALLPAADLVKVRSGETEYGIGAIPLGGYVKITGMNPEEELPPDVAPRAYYHQPVWKRIVVIGAGPGDEPPDRVPAAVRPRVRRAEADLDVADIAPDSPAAARSCGRATGSSRSTASAQRRPDRLLAPQISSHKCAGRAARRLPRGDAGGADGRARRPHRDRAGHARATTPQPKRTADRVHVRRRRPLEPERPRGRAGSRST